MGAARLRARASVDTVMQGDIRFFKRHPERRHRLRLTSLAEIERRALEHPLPAGRRWYSVMRLLGPGRLFGIEIENRDGMDVDVPEAVAAWVFAKATAPAPVGAMA